MIHCVDETNRYRASVGKPPLTRSSTVESYAATGAQVDGTAHSPHSHFIQTSGGGVAMAENEIPWWSLANTGSVQQVITGGLQLMWSEGPGGGHYENMKGNYTALGCGIFVNGDEVTVVQDYR